MSPSNVVIDWNREEDVLSVIRRGIDRSKTTNYEVSFEFVVRYDDQGQMVGFDIEEFSKTFPPLKDKTEWELMEIFDKALEYANNKPSLDVARHLVPD